MSDPVFGSNQKKRADRCLELDDYMAANVFEGENFICESYDECLKSHEKKTPDGEFYEGQLHSIGDHYDLTRNGRPFRIAVVGQEYGNRPSLVSREKRTQKVVHETGLRKRFKSDGVYEARNPHMQGTTSLLRILFGRKPGRDDDGERFSIGGSQRHIFEMFALTNFLLCSAIGDTKGKEGSKKGRSTKKMQTNCARHFRAVMRILEPTVIVALGVDVEKWIMPVLDEKEGLGDDVMRVQLGGWSCLLASFVHPSWQGLKGGMWGQKEDHRYLFDTIQPAVDIIVDNLD